MFITAQGLEFKWKLATNTLNIGVTMKSELCHFKVIENVADR